MKTDPHRNFDGVRRALFVALVVLLTTGAFSLFLGGYGGQRLSWGDDIALVLFPLLFSQIAIGFVLAAFGFLDWLRGGDPRHVMRGEWRRRESEIPLAATAIVIPIFNEEVGRVSRGVENMWQSLEKTGQIDHFDFYLLSDSNSPDHWVEEECAWISLCRRLGAFGKIFYRKRRHPINGKSGNVADFCRRWGRRYRYMIVLDADSVMAGPLMVRLVRAMEANPRVGLIQTMPSMVLGRSLFRRIQQFSATLCSGIFVRGCSFFQTSAGSYWGHNAILRLAPFIEHCGLPSLPVPDRSRRHILSHDTVEAALMQRAGYEVWVAGEEEGSYEEGPPNLSDMLKRDRRWCAGNLQHFWFLFARGIRLGNRLQIWIGLMSYLSSPLWFAFLVASSFGFYSRMRFLSLSAGPEDLGATDNSGNMVLLGVTLGLLFLPKLLGVISSLPQRRRFGGMAALLAGTAMETLLSVVMAPVLMVFHSIFVLEALLKVQIGWTTQNRIDSGLSGRACLKMYGWLAGLGLGAQIEVVRWLGDSGYWLAPICAGWILSPFLAWLTARSDLGAAARQRGLFVTPQESQIPEELSGLDQAEAGPRSGVWIEALLSPYVHAIHLALLKQRSSRKLARESETAKAVRERIVREGTGFLDRRQTQRLLWDADAVFQLHRDLWSAPGDRLHSEWQVGLDRSPRSFLLTRYLLARTK